MAQDLASYGRDRSGPGRRTRIANGPSPIAALTRAVSSRVERTRLLYLYPSGLTDELIETVLATGVPYFDLSLQHVSRPLLAGMRRWGDGDRFLRRIEDIRAADPGATFRSSFILGYPGETERDHDLLLEFLEAAQLDWAGFFPFSREDGTHAAGLDGQVPAELALERLRECAELQDAITAAKRDDLIGATRQVLVDAPGQGRTVHEAPEIDGIVHVPDDLAVGCLVDVTITGAEGPDLHAVPAADRDPVPAGVTRERAHAVSEATHEPTSPTGFTFGPSALVTPANAVTVARLLAAPVYVLMLVAWGASWINVVVGFLLAGSDGLDGYMARRHGTTRSGAFLDPLADKAVVLGALITLCRRGPPALAARHPHHRSARWACSSTAPGSAGAACPSRPANRPRSRRWCRTWRSAPASSRRWRTSTRCRWPRSGSPARSRSSPAPQYLLDGRRVLRRSATT